MVIGFLTSDLVFPSRVKAVAEKLGAELRTAATAEAIVAQIADGPSVVVVDLNTTGVDIAALAAELNALAQPPRAIIAFGPHVHEARLAAAARAGCDVVVPRGQFSAQMEELLARWIGEE